MAAVIPKTRPWTMPPRGSSDGVKERQPKMSAPQQPGSVRYSSLRVFSGPGAGSGPSAAVSAGRGASAAGGCPASAGPAAPWPGVSEWSLGDGPGGGPAVSLAMADPVLTAARVSSPFDG